MKHKQDHIRKLAAAFLAVLLLTSVPVFVRDTSAADECEVTFRFGTEGSYTMTFETGSPVTEEDLEAAALAGFDTVNGTRKIYGWYKDEKHVSPWNCETDTVRDGLVIYADTGYTTEGLLKLTEGKYYRYSGSVAIEGRSGYLVDYPTGLRISLTSAVKLSDSLYRINQAGYSGNYYVEFTVSDGTVTKLRYKESSYYDHTYVPSLRVYFDTNGGWYDTTAYKYCFVLSGGRPSKPSVDPSRKEGYNFEGWYADRDCTVRFSFSDRIYEDKTVYAGWSCDVKYDYNYQTDGKPVGVRYTEKVMQNTCASGHSPVRTGYDLKGWYLDAACTRPFDMTAPVAEPVTLYALWTPKVYTVTFNVQGHGTQPASVRTEYMGLINAPEDPTDDVYGFDGWYTDTACLRPWDMQKDTVTGDITLYAKWMPPCTVRFSMNGAQDLGSATVKYNDTVKKPEDPSDQWYTFAGWYRDSGYSIPWDFDGDRITEDTTIYAHCLYDCSVDFYSDGTLYDHQIVKHGAKLSRPDDPYDYMRIFLGWYTDPDCTAAWDFDKDTVTEDLYLYAKWNEKTYVAIDTQDGSTSFVEAVVGEPMPYFSQPGKDGSVLNGWYTDSACTKYFDIYKDPVIKDMTLYADWTDPCSVTFDYMNGITEQRTEGKNAAISQKELDEMSLEHTDASGHTVIYGWYKDKAFKNRWDPAKDRASDQLTLYADWGYTTEGILAITEDRYFRYQGNNGLRGTGEYIVDVPTGIVYFPGKAEKTGLYEYTVLAQSLSSTSFVFTAKDGAVTKIRFTTAGTSHDYYPAYGIVFDPNGGWWSWAVYSRGLVLPGGTVQKPAENPQWEDHTFEYFCTDQACTQKFDWNTKIYENMTLYAKWKGELCVRFDMQGHGTAPADIKVQSGNPVSLPADPSAEGYIFKGWFRDRECLIPWEEDIAVLANSVIYAGWEKSVLDSVTLTKDPYRTEYEPGECFDPSGMIITARYTDGTSKTFTDFTFSPDGKLAEGVASVTVNCTEDGITRSLVIGITVKHTCRGVYTVKEETCTEDGIRGHYECTCGKWYEDASCTKEISEDDRASYTVEACHLWDTGYTADKLPTCTETGTESVHCLRCDEAKDERTLPLLPHSDGDGDGHCDTCGICTEVFEFVTKNLALESDLAFRFKGYLHDESPAEDAYMEFRIGEIRTETVPLAGMEPDEKGRYVFTCHVNILEVDEKIEAIFHDGEETAVRRNPLSVTDYLDQVKANHEGKTEDTDLKTVALVDALSNYAHYAQMALDETHTDYEVAEGGKYRPTAARSRVTMLSADDFSSFAAVKTTGEGFNSIIKTSRSVMLDDKMSLCIYLKPAEEEYVPSVTVKEKNGQEVSFTCEQESDGRWKIQIPEIAAHMIGDAYTVDIDEGGMTYTNLSALSYAYSVFTSGKSENYRYAVSAMYEYYHAVMEYRK